MNPPEFIIIPTVIDQDRSLQPNDKRLYGYLYWLERLKNQEITASNKTLAELIGSGERSIRGSLERLEQACYIVRFYYEGNRHKRASIQTLVGINVPEGRNKRAYHVGTNVPQKNSSNKRVKEKSTDHRADFVVFWDEYPRKVGKLQASKAWDKLTDKQRYDAIIALPKHKNLSQWKRDGGNYIPHAATWLNQCRWEDEVEEAKTNDLSQLAKKYKTIKAENL